MLGAAVCNHAGATGFEVTTICVALAYFFPIDVAG